MTEHWNPIKEKKEKEGKALLIIGLADVLWSDSSVEESRVIKEYQRKGHQRLSSSNAKKKFNPSPSELTCRGSQKSHKDEERSNYCEPLERGGKQAHREGHRPNYNHQGREKTKNWDKHGAADPPEISESSDSDPQYWPYVDESEDGDAFEDDDYGEYGEEGTTSQHLSQVDDISLPPPKNPRKVDEKIWLY
jgi:hypothetical protein